MNTLKLFAEVVGLVGAVIGGLLAMLTFVRSVRLRRAEWLLKLYEKFYEAPELKRIRRILDYEPPAKLDRLARSIYGAGDDELAEEFVDYLNFFEFVATLRRLNQITEPEMVMLFDYYLKNLSRHDFARSFIRDENFEGLHKLLESRERLLAASPAA